MNEKSDIYSFGMIMYEMAMNMIPFAKMTSPQIVTAVLNQGKRPILPNNYDEKLRSLVERCWKYSPPERPKAIEIMAILESLLDEQSNQKELVCDKHSLPLDLLVNQNWKNNDKYESFRILQLEETKSIMDHITIEYRQVKNELIDKMNIEMKDKYEVINCYAIDNKEHWNSMKEKIVEKYRLFCEDGDKLNLKTWEGNKETWRDWMKENLDIRITPLFHMIGKNGEEIGWKICDKGFIEVKEDEWLGNGIYFSNSLEFEIEKRGMVKGDEVYVMIGLVMLGNSYPVVEDPKDMKQSLKGKPPKVKNNQLIIYSLFIYFCIEYFSSFLFFLGWI